MVSGRPGLGSRPGHLSSLGKEVLSKLFGPVPKPQSLHP